MMADVLLRLAYLTGDNRYRRPADTKLATLASLMEGYPAAFGHWLSVAAFSLAPPAQVAVVGARDHVTTRAFLDVLSGSYRPDLVVAYSPSSGNAPALIPWLQESVLHADQPAAYVCRESMCQAPATSPADLADRLACRRLTDRSAPGERVRWWSAGGSVVSGSLCTSRPYRQ